MIQRLKLLIDKDDLLDYVENHPDCGITASRLEVISSSQDNWIFFSPNDLLKKYLQDNMSYEGLTNISRSTAVWKDFLKDAVRDRYHLAGSDCPFDFMGRKNESRSIFVLLPHRRVPKPIDNLPPLHVYDITRKQLKNNILYLP